MEEELNPYESPRSESKVVEAQPLEFPKKRPRAVVVAISAISVICFVIISTIVRVQIGGYDDYGGRAILSLLLLLSCTLLIGVVRAKPIARRMGRILGLLFGLLLAVPYVVLIGALALFLSDYLSDYLTRFDPEGGPVITTFYVSLYADALLVNYSALLVKVALWVTFFALGTRSAKSYFESRANGSEAGH